MHEIRQVLDRNEQVLWQGKPRFWPFVMGSMVVSLVGLVFVGFILFGVLVGVGPMLFLFPHFWIGLFMVFGGPIYSWLVYRYIHYAITDKRVIIKSGLIGRDFKTVDYDQITNVEVNVSIWDKIFGGNSGSIYIFTAGTISYGKNGPYHTPYRLSNIPDPYKVFKHFKKVSYDIKSDMHYPNKYRPRTNPGHRTRYEPK